MIAELKTAALDVSRSNLFRNKCELSGILVSRAIKHFYGAITTAIKLISFLREFMIRLSQTQRNYRATQLCAPLAQLSTIKLTDSLIVA